MSVGKQIRDRRLRAGMSQVELATISGVSLPTLQNIEGDKANPSLHTLSALATQVGLELKLVERDVDWDYLACAGVPLTTNTSKYEIPTLEKTKKELNHLFCIELSFRQRHAVAAFLLALDHHYPHAAKQIVPRKAHVRFANLYDEPATLKLKRIALSRMAKYL